MQKDELDILRGRPAPAAQPAARERAVRAALDAFHEEKSTAAQGRAAGRRLSDRALRLWSTIMNHKAISAPAFAGLLALPIAGYLAIHMMETSPFAFAPAEEAATPAEAPQPMPRDEAVTAVESPRSQVRPAIAAPKLSADMPSIAAAPPSRIGPMAADGGRRQFAPATGAADHLLPEPSRDRLAAFSTNPLRSVLESPVSTFSIDVDTTSYSFVRRLLRQGVMPDPDTVRVEEMINYFPYDWPGPDSADTPFRSTVNVVPTPWNPGTKLMHVAIKGYNVAAAERPRANLVFLIDTSGSMNAPDRLPLVKSAFRLLLDQLDPDDTVAIVTYAGEAGVALEPTRAAERGRITAAIDRLQPGGRTAGEAGIREAYRLAQQGFVEGGVNRVLLATDGDFNVGQSDDAELKRMIEDKRASGVNLSVLGFGLGNFNDRLMQEIAQNGNGVAAYIDTLAEAEKVMVQEARSTLFTIAQDVKIQVEFNPATVSEYRLIGYETRGLERQDFNDDRVDAGDIGSGHSIAAIYEITPKDSPAAMMEPLRYGRDAGAGTTAAAESGEYAFVRLRYKLPGEEISRLIETPVGAAREVSSFVEAGDDLRFSVAVAAFGQKLRRTRQLAATSYDEIGAIAAAARGTDPYGYRSEFLTLLRLASALDGQGR